jgi:hypothetical protein
MDDELRINDLTDITDPDGVKDLDRAQYEMGVQSRLDGEPFDPKRSAAWQLGWERCRLRVE